MKTRVLIPNAINGVHKSTAIDRTVLNCDIRKTWAKRLHQILSFIYIQIHMLKINTKVIVTHYNVWKIAFFARPGINRISGYDPSDCSFLPVVLVIF